MAHEIDMSTGEAAMAYTGHTPWHQLGFQLQKGASIEEWAKAAKMEWEIFRTPVKFDIVRDKPVEGFSPDELARAKELFGLNALTETLIYPDKHVLYRSDTNAPLSVVSPSYNIVQPIDVLEFYRDLVGVAGMELETAGVLFGGRRFWALANTGNMVELAGQKVKHKKVDIDPRTGEEVEYEEEIEIPDQVKGYLLLTTSCDGTLATTAQFTSVRVVCNNTLAVATRGNETKIRVPHNRIWNPAEVREQLGFVDAGWQNFRTEIEALSNRHVGPVEAAEFLVKVFGDEEITIDQQSPAVAQKCANVWDLFTGNGMGSKMKSAEDTVWGLLNAVTETVDYHTSHRTTDARLNNSWYGSGNALKTKAFELALDYCQDVA